MHEYKCGMLAWSRAGHDEGTLYVIVGVEGDFLLLCDGRLRPLEKPKKKNCRHVQVRKEIPEELTGFQIENFRNEDIRRVIRRISNV